MASSAASQVTSRWSVASGRSSTSWAIRSAPSVGWDDPLLAAALVGDAVLGPAAREVVVLHQLGEERRHQRVASPADVGGPELVDLVRGDGLPVGVGGAARGSPKVNRARFA